MDDIMQQVQTILSQMQQATVATGRNADAVTMLAVSKTKPASMLTKAYQAGIRDFGENYLQEALPKQQQLANLAIVWHFIGHIQSNKTRDVAENFSWVSSVDSAKILRRLSAQRPINLQPLQVLLQVNISAETNKSGISPDAMLELAELCSALPNLKLRGLMAIPRPGSDEEAARDFTAMKLLFDQLQQIYPDVDTLSMGMSDDFTVAIACGATQVRIGSLLFGARTS